MNKIINSQVSGDIPQLYQMGPGDIAINNADAIMWILHEKNGVKSIVQISGVVTFNGRAGAITLTSNDVTTALGFNPVNTMNGTLLGIPTAPTADPGTSTTQLATTAFVQNAIQGITFPSATQRLDKLLDVKVTEGAGIDGMVLQYSDQAGFWEATALSPVAFTGQYSSLTGKPSLSTVALTGSYTDLINKPTPYSLPVASNSSLGGIIVGTTLTVATDGTLNAPYPTQLSQLTDVNVQEIVSENNTVLQFQSSSGKWTNKALANVAFTGSYTDLSNPPSFVATFNGRAGSVTFQATDIVGVGGALLASPAFTGTPTAPTATAGTNSTQIATTAFVANALASYVAPSSYSTLASLTDVSIVEGAGINGYVLSYNSGASKWNATALAKVATTGSYTDLTNTPSLSAYALLASPTFSGTPAAPTAAAGTNTTQLATTAFVAASKYYDVQGGAVGTIGANQLMVQFVSGRTVTFPAGLTGSVGYAAVAPTGSVTFTIAANGSNVGTMVFAASSKTATFTASTTFTLTPGQLLTVTAPSSADSTLATVSFTLLGLAT